jgi:hypothetical protein
MQTLDDATTGAAIAMDGEEELERGLGTYEEEEH